MSRLAHRPAAESATTDYVGWRGELLAQLALARLPHVAAYHSKSDHGYDYVVATPAGFCFFVAVNAFSSSKEGMPDVASRPELHRRVDRGLVEWAKTSRSPVVLFLFDADTEHGRFLRLDTLPQPSSDAKFVTLRLPVENTIDKRSLDRLLADLQKDGRAD